MKTYPGTITRLVVTLLIGMTTLISAGCLQLSLNPLFTADDAVFEEQLVGQWTCGNETWTFRRAADQDVPPSAYDVDIQSGTTEVTVVALLGRLGERTFVTLTPARLADPSSSPFVNAHVSTGFTFGRVAIEGDRLRFAMLDSGWINKAYQAGLLTIGMSRMWPGARPDDVDVVLTAGPSDLQRFARAYADDDAVFGEQIRFRRVGSTPASQPAGSGGDEKCYGK